MAKKAPTSARGPRKAAAPTEPGTRRPSRAGRSPAGSVDDFMNALDHPLKPAVEALRRVLRAASPGVEEGIKWNSPSFRTTEWFATVNLRGKGGEDRVWLILHAGARAKPDLKGGGAIPDPDGILEWLGKDRALVTFENAAHVRKRKAAIEAIVRAWIRHV